MKTKAQVSILEDIRSLKEENAAAYGFSLDEIIASARERQETSGRRIIRLKSQEDERQDVVDPQSDSESSGAS